MSRTLFFQSGKKKLFLVLLAYLNSVYMSTEVKAKTAANAGNKHRHFRKNHSKQAKKPVAKKAQEEEESASSEEDNDGELCFICTEPIKTFAVAQCDHRTCHKCTLRLRALYDTRNCAYCKVSVVLPW